MNKNLSLKLRSPKGIISLENISPLITLSEFKNQISAKTNIPPASLIIKVGYPPKNIAKSKDSTVIKDFEITSGDLIIIEEDLTIPKPKSEPKNKEYSLDLNSIASEQTPNKDGLIMIRRIIPADNSCLFHAISFNLNPKAPFHDEEYRQIIASYILSDPKHYEGLLEKDPEAYAKWILQNTSWGGEVELHILAKHHNVEICTYNIRNCKSLIYGEGPMRMFLLYDGIHYDSVVRNICDEITENDETMFSKDDISAMEGCLILANSLRKKRQFTDLANFDIQCQVCFEGLKGEKGVAEHSKKTGHFNFKEIENQK